MHTCCQKLCIYSVYYEYIQITHTYIIFSVMMVQFAACLGNWELTMETSGLSTVMTSLCLTACLSSGADFWSVTAAVTLLFENHSEKEDWGIAGIENASSSSLTGSLKLWAWSESCKHTHSQYFPKKKISQHLDGPMDLERWMELRPLVQKAPHTWYLISERPGEGQRKQER